MPRRALLALALALLWGATGASSVFAQASWSTQVPMSAPRTWHTATLLLDGTVLVSGGLADGQVLASNERYDPVSLTWIPAAPTLVARWRHSSTLLLDGRVLIVGLGSAEIYDPTTDQWSLAGAPSPFFSHTATRLADGRVLVVGGISGNVPLSSCQLYDPATGLWSSTGSLATARAEHTASLLPDGRVLVVGGCASFSGGSCQSGSARVGTAEVYDPASGLWSAAGALSTARNTHTATALADGTVLVHGGRSSSSILASVELWSPVSGWSTAPSAFQIRSGHAAVLLPSGDVLVAGGSDGSGFPDVTQLFDSDTGTWSTSASLNSGRYSHTLTLLASGQVLATGGVGGGASAEVFDPPAGSWSASNPLTPARFSHTATLLPDGSVLVVGGSDGSNPLTSVVRSDGASWSAAASLSVARSSHTATLLPGGKVLIAGGDNGGALTSASLFDPIGGAWSDTGVLTVARYAHTATVLADGRVLVAGGRNEPTSFTTTTAEIYDSAGGIWSATGPMNIQRSSHTATLLPSGRVLVAGGSNGASMATCELFDPETGTWSMTGAMSNSRQGHAAALLPDGRVLVAAGFPADSNAEVYDEGTGVWTPTGSLPGTFSEGVSAAVLGSGKVLLTGPEPKGEVYDPASGTWKSTGGLVQERRYATTTPMPDGRVLLAGGMDLGSAPLGSAELYASDDFDPQRRPVILGEPTLATYDPSLEAPACGLGASLCDSGALLDGRDTIAGGPEPNQPNTLGSSCADGTGGSYHSRESIDRLLLYTDDGGPFATGKTVTVEAHVWAFDANDVLDLYFTANATSPSWTLVGSIAAGGAGPQVLTAGYTLPAGSPQAIRASFRFQGTPSPCSGGTYDEADDLVFATDPGPARYGMSVAYGVPFALSGNRFRSDSEASGGGGHNNSAVNHPAIQLQSLSSGRIHGLLPDSLLSPAVDPTGEDPLTLELSRLPPGIDVGWHFLRVTSAGVPSEARIVEMACSLEITSQPANATAAVGTQATFSVATQGGRSFQWQRDGVDIPGALGPSYITPPVIGPDSGSTYRVLVRGNCSSLLSQPATLTVADSDPPMAAVLEPAGGEFLLLSEAGSPPQTELVTWSMADDVRICRVEVALVHSNNGGSTYTATPPGGGLPAAFGPGGTCPFPGVSTTSLDYVIPSEFPSGTSGSLYKIRVTVTDHVGLQFVAESTHPFFIVRPNAETVRTLILSNTSRLQAKLGITNEKALDLDRRLQELAGHPRVLGLIVDLGGNADVLELLAAWDAAPGDAARANHVLFGCDGPPFATGCPSDRERDGVHDLARSLLEIYTGVHYLVLVGDDRILPFARHVDRTSLLPESTYANGVDLQPSGSTVAQALAGGFYLSDDPLAVLDTVRSEELDGEIFVPDLSVGRVVETPDEIVTTIATFIAQDGVLDLPALESTTDHKVLVTGYDFLSDVAGRIERRWTSRLGDTSPSDPLAPIDAELIGADWGEGTVSARQAALHRHLDGDGDGFGGGRPYGIASLSGHASHYGIGVPGTNPFDIRGLDALDVAGADGCGNFGIGALDLSGSVVYGVGCHGGLPVPGSCSSDADHSLDLPQTLLSRGAVAYVANTGYGWGLLHGIGYGERLVELLSEELTAGGTAVVGDAVRRSKLRYFLETPRFDAYDEKSLQQWTLFGLPMYAVRTGLAAGSSTAPSDGQPSLARRSRIERFGGVVVERDETEPNRASLPPYLTRVDLHFDFTAPGVYTKYDALGRTVSGETGCPQPLPGEPEGCYYSLNGLVERSSGAGDLPVQPYFIYDSKLSGTSQHGVFWKGGVYDEESSWVPIVGTLVSNSVTGVGDDHGSTPRTRMGKPVATRLVPGEDPPQCRASDLELNRLLVGAGETVSTLSPDDTERIYREVDLEVFYFNNTGDGAGNCDRNGPLLSSGPFAGDYHLADGRTIQWAVPATDTDGGVWRVIVVYSDNTVDAGGRGRWVPVELVDDGSGTFRGELTVTSEGTILTYVIQAADRRGNVTWLDFVSTDLPNSGVDRDIPDPRDVDVVPGTADLGIRILDSPDPAMAASALAYTIAIDNSGPAAATAVAANLALPQSVHLNAASGSGWTCSSTPDGAACNRNLLAVGSAPPITIVVTPLSDGLISTTATVDAFESDPSPANDTDLAETLVQASSFADLELSILFAGSGKTGTPVSYTLTVVNSGPDDVVDAAVTFAAPAVLIGPSWTCSASLGSTCTPAGNGSFFDTIDLPVAGSVSYLVSGIISPAAIGLLSAVSTVVGPPGTSDPDPLDNGVRHDTVILGKTIFVDGFESGDLSVWSAFRRHRRGSP